MNYLTTENLVAQDVEGNRKDLISQVIVVSLHVSIFLQRTIRPLDPTDYVEFGKANS